ncbi:MAG TPA: hypothetical protein VHJ18_08850 [Streptosporangiaceae bacterium]|jgi:hypothetical protein|nr:hypothetical protein [Streptosporangiaceae bacterium]
MAVWDELKVVLVRLRDEQPRALLGYPMPEVDEGRRPPFNIRLAAWASATAQDLYRQFGDDVDLTVGALPYPPGGPAPPRPTAGEPAALLDPQELTAELDGPAIVRSGESVGHGLLLTNLTQQHVQIETNGHVTADVVDPNTGEVIGGSSGPQLLPLIVFRVEPGQTERIPLLIGTDSIAPQLGYTIPPGNWGLQVTFTLGPHPRDSPNRRTPILPLTITA